MSNCYILHIRKVVRLMNENQIGLQQKEIEKILEDNGMKSDAPFNMVVIREAIAKTIIKIIDEDDIFATRLKGVNTTSL